MEKKQLAIVLGIVFVFLIVILQTISRDDNTVTQDFELKGQLDAYNLVLKEDYERVLEEIENEEDLYADEEENKIQNILDTGNIYGDQLLDRGKRFLEAKRDVVDRLKDPLLNPLPNFKGNNGAEEGEIQNPVAAARTKQGSETNKDPNYAQNRLSELINLAQQNMDSSNQTPVVQSNGTRGAGIKISETCYIPKGRKTCAPSYIIAGAMKCGTTSMYAYLTSHPKVLELNPSAKLNGKPVLANKEVRFWLDPSYSSLVKNKGEDGALNEYLNLFYPITVSDPYFGEKHQGFVDYISGEASPMYICQFGVAERIYNHLPYIKIIIMLRNPLDRAYSELWFKDSLTKGKPVDVDSTAYNKNRFQTCLRYESEILKFCNVTQYSSKNSLLSPSDLYACVTSVHSNVRSGKCAPEQQFLCNKYNAVGACGMNNIKNSLYSIQIREWVQFFGGDRNQLLVIKSEDFYESTTEWMKITSEFLGIEEGNEDFNWDSITSNAFNIVNPGTASAQGMELQDSAPGLKMGSTSVENVSQYPDMDEDFRVEVSKFFAPLNVHLAELINQPVFWPPGSHKGD